MFDFAADVILDVPDIKQIAFDVGPAKHDLSYPVETSLLHKQAHSSRNHLLAPFILVVAVDLTVGVVQTQVPHAQLLGCDHALAGVVDAAGDPFRQLELAVLDVGGLDEFAKVTHFIGVKFMGLLGAVLQ